MTRKRRDCQILPVFATSALWWLDPSVSLAGFGKLAGSLGLSPLDLAAQVILNSVAGTSILVFAVLFSGKVNQISALCKQFAAISTSESFKGKALGQRSRSYAIRMLAIIYSFGEVQLNNFEL